VLAHPKGRPGDKAAAPERPGDKAPPAPADRPAASVAAKVAVAAMRPTAGQKTQGTVRFVDSGNGRIQVIADLDGLQPGQKHGFHIHEFGDCSKPDAASAGDHFNPGGHDHGLPDKGHRHGGDLGNVTADGKGRAHYEITLDNVTLTTGPTAIAGRGVIVHLKQDDGGQPTGNAGPRIACGVIGLTSAK